MRPSNPSALTFAGFKILITVAVATVALTGCGIAGLGKGGGSGEAGVPDGVSSSAPAKPRTLFAEDFRPVCEGASVSAAKAYDKAAGGHKAVFFESFKDKGLVDSSHQLPADWTVLFDPNGNVYADIDVVICAKRTAEKFAADCDGYKVDDKPSPLVIKMHTASYQVTAFEATTGQQLGSKEIAAKDGSCPTFVASVPEGTTAMNDYATPDDEEIIAFAKPFVQP